MGKHTLKFIYDTTASLESCGACTIIVAKCALLSVFADLRNKNAINVGAMKYFLIILHIIGSMGTKGDQSPAKCR